ncbi:exo-beta-N-acetylmuramidase NamZ family protein [Geofilum rhodophaeum]|uniref:exo-beta-N-acetylmuramidase NamZ family protein n=1 Tax=Geofilum rhodophaeum TaxID=1965019 RepID=UPI000B5271CD|nr:DUF1343 domain-containing protein [Geofilum rhodophaeum]
MSRQLLWLMLVFPLFLCCRPAASENGLRLGAERTELWKPLLEGKRIGLLVNHSSRVGPTHLLDTMLTLGLDVQRIFVPEHGFRGNADAGAHIADGRDPRSGLPIISLYGTSKKPSSQQLEGLDVLVFDLQDVGVRFYTYASSMHYLMEACAEENLPVVVFDRPNPNGDYIDGPVLNLAFQSFVGMHPLPVVHGLTLGELAEMINGEGWLSDGVFCDLTVVEMANYRHDSPYELPLPPSPNLPNALSIRLYPSLCLFEGTEVSIGRGTPFPFQVAGYPNPSFGSFTFTPQSGPGAQQPLQEGQLCYGIDLRQEEGLDHRFTLKYLLAFYEKSGRKADFISRRRFFNLLAGGDRLLQQIESGMSETEIRASWEDELAAFSRLRARYLLYP